MRGMKYIVCVADGIADYPQDDLDNLTPLAFAKTPYLDKVASLGQTGLIRAIPKGMEPGSDRAHLSLLGYDPKRTQCSRAVIEAAGYGVEIQPNHVAFRLNFVTVFDGVMTDYCAGNLSTKESRALIEALNAELAMPGVSFYAGDRYKNIMLVDRDKIHLDAENIRTVAPHDIIEQKVDANFPTGSGSGILIDIMKKAEEILGKHEINSVKRDLNEFPANSIWVWGGGKTPHIENIQDKFAVKACMLTPARSMLGLAKLVGIDTFDVRGVSGEYNQLYSHVAAISLPYLETYDCVIIYVDDSDKASHNGSVSEKIKAIEAFDRYIIGPIISALQKQDSMKWRLLVSAGQMTPVELRKHVADPVPYVIAGNDIKPDKVTKFSEESVKKRRHNIREGHTVLPVLFA